MQLDDDANRAAELLERLLTDAAFRSRFRRDPAGVCADYGLQELAQSLGSGENALQTLEIRESRSSLAGAFMAAAGEGAGALDSIRQLHEHQGFSPEAAPVVRHVLSNPRLQALHHEAPPPPALPLDASVEHVPSSAPGASGVFEALQPSAHPAVAGPGSTVQFLPAMHGHQAVDSTAHDAPVDAVNSGDASVLPDPTDPYPGDQASPEAIAGWMARQAHKAGLPGELPVMAGLVESDLRNVHYGDRDSLGFFQMRLVDWGHGEYAGYQNHPELQLKWFLDQALAVQKQHLGAGDASFGQDDASWGNWVADVERPAESLRFKYQLRLDQAREYLADPASAPVAAPAFDHAAAQPDAGAESVQAAGAVALAQHYLGTPYRWGGTTPAGFDCSGFVQYLYHHEGIQLPRVADQQFLVGTHVSRADLAPGDLIYFRNSTGYIHHVGMYVGGDRFIHAPHTGDVVKISSLDEPYYAHQFAGGRRLVEMGEPGAMSPAGAAVEQQPASGSDVFSALDQRAQPQPPRNTVQFLPSVKPPGSESSGTA